MPKVVGDVVFRPETGHAVVLGVMTGMPHKPTYTTIKNGEPEAAAMDIK